VLALLARDVPGEWLVVEDAHGSADAVVVLAGDPGYERTATAASLLEHGRGRLLIVTGGEAGPGDSARSLREFAVGLGVPLDRIRMEEASRSTREEFVALVPILRAEGVRTVIVVTSPYHARRARLAARKALAGVTVFVCPAAPSAWTPHAWWRTAASRRVVLTEYAKLAYYGLRGWI
jgi:uncharacterized SAM-binding protein YcdF (DUF218 family)